MHKQEFEAIAQIITNTTVKTGVCGGNSMVDKQLLVKSLSKYFQNKNKLFQENRFVSACNSGN